MMHSTVCNSTHIHAFIKRRMVVEGQLVIMVRYDKAQNSQRVNTHTYTLIERSF